MTKTGKETAAEKKARLAAALRANMHKRKAQARGRRSADAPSPGRSSASGNPSRQEKDGDA